MLLPLKASSEPVLMSASMFASEASPPKKAELELKFASWPTSFAISAFVTAFILSLMM